MACDPQTLLTNAECFQCYGYGSMLDAMEVVLLCAIRDGNTSMACDPQSLLSEANCLICELGPIPGAFQAVRISLLCQIAAAGGGGGGGTIQVYEARDPAPPDNVNEAALNFPLGGGTLTQWSVDLQAWV